MAYELTIDGYTFENPPEDYRKRINLGNSAQPHFNRQLADFYFSDSKDLQVELSGTLSLNHQSDLDELERLQELAIEGGEVAVEFDPFFSGKCVIEDDPFRQSDNLSNYRFVLTVNEDTTDSSAYPDHATPTTGNTFELGGFDFGYDPNSVEENYERETDTVDRLQGVSRTVDNAGLVTSVSIEGHTDGGGVAQLWDKAMNNTLGYLNAEFQNGWALIGDLSIRNNAQAPDYLKGLFDYQMEVFVVSNPDDGIGQVTQFIDHDVKDLGTYVSDDTSGESEISGVEFSVSNGTGSINGTYVQWDDRTVTLAESDTNYVYVVDPESDGSGNVEVDQASFPINAIPLYRVVTDNGNVEKLVDVKARLIKKNDHEAGDALSDTKDRDGDGLANWAYYSVAGGISPDYANGQGTEWYPTTLQLIYNTTNYVYVDPVAGGTGDVSISQTGYPSDVIELWRVETDPTRITNEIDDRPDGLTTEGSGDTSRSDLTFEDSLVMDDRNFGIFPFQGFSDTLSLTETPAFFWLLDSSDVLSLTDTPDYASLHDQSDAMNLRDGSDPILKSVSWGTASDWDNASDETAVRHDDDAIRLSPGHDGYEDIEDGYPVPGYSGDAFNLDADDSRSWNGSKSVKLSGNGWRYDLPEPPDESTTVASFYWNETSNQDGFEIAYEDPNGDDLIAVGSNNLEVEARYGSTNETLFDATGDYDVWYYWEVTFHWDTNTADLYFHDPNGNYSDQTRTGVDFINGRSADTVATVRCQDQYFGTSADDMWLDEFWGPYYEGSLTTATKSLGASAQPNIKNVTYSLNGESATLHITGSPGEQNEETVTKALDGSSSYTLDWDNDHEDFQVEVELQSESRQDTPSIDTIELEAEVQQPQLSGPDDDHNPNTNWKIIPGQYDRAGNEYEGGGTTLTYES